MEFLLGSASSYGPTDTVSLEDVMFLFQVSPGSERIVAHGFNRVGKTLFAVYAILGDGKEVLVEGYSGQTASSGTPALLVQLVNCGGGRGGTCENWGRKVHGRREKIRWEKIRREATFSRCMAGTERNQTKISQHCVIFCNRNKTK